MYRLLNSAVMPEQGVYRLTRINAEHFATLVRLAHESGELASYTGYEQTAEFISRLAGVPIEVCRDSTPVNDGDRLLI